MQVKALLNASFTISFTLAFDLLVNFCQYKIELFAAVTVLDYLSALL